MYLSQGVSSPMLLSRLSKHGRPRKPQEVPLRMAVERKTERRSSPALEPWLYLQTLQALVWVTETDL